MVFFFILFYLLLLHLLSRLVPREFLALATPLVLRKRN